MLDVKKKDFLTLFFASPVRGKSPRYEILLVYYLKSDSVATTFDFFQLDALVTLRENVENP